MESDNDLSQPYMAVAQATTADAAIEAFARRMQSKNTPPVPEGGAPAARPAPNPDIELPKDGKPLKITIRPLSVWEKVGGAVSSGAGAAGRVAGDVLYGTAVESVPAAVGGVNDAVRNAATGLKSVGDWLQDNIGGEIPVPSTGNETLDTVIQRPLEALANALPEKTKDQKTVTGHVIREGARFLTGFVPALRAFGGASVPGMIGAGAVTDFATMDPNQAGLANLVQAAPVLGKPIADFLGTDPNDNEALNRLRHAVEGAGFGVLTEGIVRGIRAVSTARKAVPEMEAQTALYGEISPSQLMVPGNADGPLVTIGAAPTKASDGKLGASVVATESGVPDDVVAKGVLASSKQTKLIGGEKQAQGAAGASEPDIFINFSRINTPDDIKQVISDVSVAFKSDINRARRGVQSNEQTARLADELGMTAEDLLARRAGQPLNAEESLAARRLLNTSAEKLLEMAKTAASPNATLADQFNFRRMLAVHHGIQSEVIAARTETARALQAWSIPAGTGNVEMARSIQMLMDNMGGSAVTADLAKRMALLSNQGVPAGALANMVRKGWGATTSDAVKEAFVMGLLWSPSTHVVNSASNLAVAFQQVYERGAAARIGDALGSAVGERVASGEAIAMAYGTISALKDAFRLGARALRTGETGASVGSKVDLPRDPAISTAAIARERQMTAPERQAFAESGMGRAIDFTGEAFRVPGRLLAAEDEFFKTIAYRGEVHAQALRQATQEGKTGSDLWKRMAEIANDPPEHIRISASDAALYSTFQQKPGEWAQALMAMRESGWMNPTFLVLPFIKTPANILRYSFERSPLAPLVGQWREDVAAGGARAHLALARMGTGTAVFSTAMDMASSGAITGPGPSDPGQREAMTRQGWQPWSVYIDGQYYSYSRTDPFGMALAAAGTLAELSKSRELSPEDFDEFGEVMASAIGGLSQAVVDKTFFRGVTEVLDMVHGASKGEGGVVRYIDRQTGSLLPFTTALNTARRAVDPVTREVNSPWDAVQSRIAGMSDKLTPARDLWGAERKPQEIFGRAFDIMSPVAVSKEKVSPIDAEMQRLGVGVERIKKNTSFQNTAINFRDFPKIYDEYVRLAGNELKHPAWQMGAKDYLDAVVSGRHSMSDVYSIYSDGPEGGKAAFIKNTIADYRKLAQQQIMGQRDRFGDFIDVIGADAERRNELKMPVTPPVKNTGSQLPR